MAPSRLVAAPSRLVAAPSRLVAAPSRLVAAFCDLDSSIYIYVVISFFLITATAASKRMFRGDSLDTCNRIGWRFHPTDCEAITHYLNQKIANPDHTYPMIQNSNAFSIGPHCHLGMNNNLPLYIFTHCDSALKKDTPDGYWQQNTDSTKVVNDGLGRVVGCVHFYKFFSVQGDDTNYCLEVYSSSKESLDPSGWELCRIFLGVEEQPVFKNFVLPMGLHVDPGWNFQPTEKDLLQLLNLKMLHEKLNLGFSHVVIQAKDVLAGHPNTIVDPGSSTFFFGTRKPRKKSGTFVRIVKGVGRWKKSPKLSKNVTNESTNQILGCCTILYFYDQEETKTEFKMHEFSPFTPDESDKEKETAVICYLSDCSIPSEIDLFEDLLDGNFNLNELFEDDGASIAREELVGAGGANAVGEVAGGANAAEEVGAGGANAAGEVAGAANATGEAVQADSGALSNFNIDELFNEDVDEA